MIDIGELKKQASTGKYLVHGDVSEADCVLGFSFGFVKRGDKVLPGKSNQQIADFATGHFSSLPMIMQSEIADALSKEVRHVYRVEKHKVEGKYLHSREIAVQALNIMKQNGWKKAVILAHSYHLPRVDACCQKTRIDTIAPEGLEIIDFDEFSEQKWTRSAKEWSARESKTINIFAARNWI